MIQETRGLRPLFLEGREIGLKHFLGQAMALAAFWLYMHPGHAEIVQGPQTPATSTTPAPLKTEISNLSVTRGQDGNWNAQVSYSYSGTPAGAFVRIRLTGDGESDIDPNPNIFNVPISRGSATVQLPVSKPDTRGQAYRARNVEAQIVAISPQETRVLAQLALGHGVDWPDERTALFNQSLSRLSPQEAFNKANQLIALGDTQSLVQAKRTILRLKELDPAWTQGDQALAQIESRAVWGPQGGKKLQKRADIKQEVDALASAEAFAEMDLVATRLREAQSITDKGYLVLHHFQQVLGNDVENGLNVTGWERLAGLWLAAQPHSCTAIVLTTDIYLARAWAIRGYGFASTVSPEKWTGFKRWVDKALTFAQKHKSTCDADPRWYRVTLQGMLGTSKPQEYEAVLAEALGKFPDDLALQTSAANFYSPAWGGSAKAVEKFAQKVIQRLPAGERDVAYARYYSQSFTYGASFSSPDVSAWHVDCKRWVKGVESIADKAPTTYNINLAAFTAVHCGDKKVARKYFQRMKGAPPMWEEWGSTPSDAAKEFARASVWVK